MARVDKPPAVFEVTLALCEICAPGSAGAGTQVLTRGKTVKVPAETTLRFKLDQPLTLQAAY
jgi:hypothetical protein